MCWNSERANSRQSRCAPGQFWASYKFSHEQIVVDEQLEVSVPRERTVKLKSALVQPVIADNGAYRTYTWHSSNLQHPDTSDKRRRTELSWQVVRGRTEQPDVWMSSFTTWAEVGRWYGGLQQERVKPTPEVAAKAAELTKNAATEEAKIRALYNYVSTQFHYIGVAFGVGRYQPHSAAAVMENQYGDCKDKHTLLASLLTAVGIPAYPALIGTMREVEPDVPSPGQFDHVITVVPRNGSLVWLDTTAEVGPYQFLLAPLRDKHALAIWEDRPAELVKIPADLPYPTSQTFNMDAKLSDDGTLVGKAVFTARGDMEYLLRASFRSVPVPQWKDLVQRISQAFGFGGDVSEVTAISPEKTDEPFQFSYRYTRKEFGDWPNHRILAPEPFVNLPGPSDEDLLPLGPTWLGSPVDIDFQSRVELPNGYVPTFQPAIHFKNDFAQFDATYDYKDGKLVSERHVKVLLREAPASERDQYKEFAKKVQDDYGAFIPLVSGAPTAPAYVGKRNPTMPTIDALRNLPDSSNSEATRLANDARDAVGKHDIPGAVASLYRAVQADPKFTRGWVLLGDLLLMQNQKDAGMEAFHKAIESDPSEAAIPKALGMGLMAAQDCDGAIPVWQDFMKSHPEDVDGPANLANCYIKLEKFSDAATTYEKAVKLRSDLPNLQGDLASAYLRSGQRDKATEAYRKVAEADTQGAYLNDAAYQMANSDLSLPLALNFAEKAVRKVEEASQKVTLPDLKVDDLKMTLSLAATWDTLGWVNERMSNFTAAEQYLQASWKVSQDGVVAGHLCHMYRRLHQRAKGIQMCELAISRIPVSSTMSLDDFRKEIGAAKENLRSLTSGPAGPKSLMNASDQVMRERTFKLPRFLAGTESAEFFVLVTSDGTTNAFKVSDVKFISGSSKMKLEGKRLKTLNFNVTAPDQVPARFVRRGILGCYQYSGCSFVLIDPQNVHSVD
jgi:tetratricopeptide (TPR) repeat protein